MNFLERQNTEYYMGYKRGSKHRIFVNRSLQLGKIKFFGFDMDYTLAMYKSPELETMSFNLLTKRMVEIGYPKEFSKMTYDPTFPIRGLWVDKRYGNLLKMDNYGNILMAFHGLNRLSNTEIVEMYPNKFVKFDTQRMSVTNTLYNLPETYLIAATINYFESQKDNEKLTTGVNLSQNVTLSFSSIIQDIRDCMDYVHMGSEMSDIVIQNLDTYVERCPELAEMLMRIKNNGAKTFLLTNSDFQYTEKICRYILYCEENKTNWHNYFDYIVTNSRKPRFFFEGSLLRVINTSTNRLELGHHTGPLESGVVYSGGSVETFSKLIGARGKDVLYFGDHIFGDILKSKKIVGWKTCLIVPELENEIFVWQHKGSMFEDLKKLHVELAELYRNLDLGSTDLPDVREFREKTQNLARTMEDSYGTFGSLFRCGARQTFFAGQVLMYADLYTTSCLNLMRYPLCYMFQAPFMLMPHESTVAHITTDFDELHSNSISSPIVASNNGDLINKIDGEYLDSPLPPIGLRRRSLEAYNSNQITSPQSGVYNSICPTASKFVNKSPDGIEEEKE